MKRSSPLTIVFLLHIVQQALISTMADKQFITNTCKGTPYPDLCLNILLANPRSQNADLTGLALIGVDAANNKGLEIIKQIVALKMSRPELRQALDHCAEVYHTWVTAVLPSAKEALRDGMPKFAEDAIADGAVEADSCERGFGEHGQTSPITDSNNAMNKVANVVRGIIRMLL